ncbi:pseudouridine synthase Pus7 protein [Rutstroemia sp. NJR-2017a WRK4]|nr:pseudouridine synthase Pus7 protein [Rutstroemia sp. NJR-2017a WRK4]
MTSLENDGSIQSPRKRQKLESSTISQPLDTQPLDTPQLNTMNQNSALNNNSDIAMENSDQKQQDPTSNASEPEREAEAGILHYVNKSNPGFQGVLKQRYTDFMVNEITLDGEVVHLRNDRAPWNKHAARTNDDTVNAADENQVPAASVKEELALTESPTLPPATAVESVASADTSTATSSDPTNPSAEASAEASGDAVSQSPVKELRPNDLELLAEYFGSNLALQIVGMDKKIQQKPNAKPATIGSLTSEPVDDKQRRGRLHQFVRRVFEGRLETEGSDDGTITVFAASQKSRGSNSTTTPRQGNHRNNGAQQQTKGKLGWEELGGQYLHFTLFKENKDTMESILLLSRMLKVKPKDFAYAGTKDRRAVTAQRVSAFRHHAQRLASLNPKLWGAKVGDFKYEKFPLRLGDLEGNEFTITLRDCHFGEDPSMSDDEKVELAKEIVGKAVEHIRTHGFINYFGLQRFGTFGIGTDVIGKKILQDDFKGAVDSILSYTEEALAVAQQPGQYEGKIGRDDVARAQAIHEFKQTGKDRCLHRLPRRFGAETAIIKHLASRQGQNDYQGAILAIPRNHRTIFVHAYQSLVWNTVASERWSLHGDKVVEGDLVLVEGKANEQKDEYDENGEIVIHPAGDDVALTSDDVFQRARPLSAEEAASGKFTIFDIVLPLPGFDIEYPANKIGDFYKEFMSSERGGGLDPADMRRRQKDFSLSGSYRKLLGRVRDDISFEVRKYHDEIEQLVETDYEIIQKSRGHFKNQHQQNKNNGAALRENRNGQFNNRGGRQNGNEGHANQNGRHMADTAAQGRQNSIQYAGSAQHNAWKALPEKLAAEDKAAAEAWEVERQTPVDVDSIQQPIYKETFIQTSATNEGRRTGVRTTQILNGKNEVIDENDPKDAAEVPEILKVEKTDAPAGIIQENSIVTDSGDDNETQDGGVKLEASVILKRSAKEMSESSASATKHEDGAIEVTEVKPEIDVSVVSGEILPVETTTEPTEAPSTDVEMTGLSEPADISQKEPSGPARLAVILKLGLGSSVYATMALRELMQHGGVQVYKPDFSSGR